MNNTMIALHNMCKSFGSVKAVDDVSVKIGKGEIRALIGENGSGKSTLVSLITGVHRMDSGEIHFNGKLFSPKGLIDSKRNGIAVLQQEKGTVDGLSVAENIFLGSEDQCGSPWSVSRKKMCQKAQAALDAVGADHISAAEMIDRLSFEDRKLVEVARAMNANPYILIVDETTTALSMRGRETIYEIIRKMKAEGKTVIFISHDLDEICQVCDSATVLRDGKYISTVTKESMYPHELRPLMIGRELTGSFYRTDCEDHLQGSVVLSVDGVWLGNTVKNVSFELHQGEILGLGGLTECGMHELCKIVFGAIKPDRGQVFIVHDGEKQLITDCTNAIDHKIAYLPKDRDAESLFSTATIRENIAVSSLDQLRSGPYISPKKEHNLAIGQIQSLSIKCNSDTQYVSELSGGNKQKVVIGKWLANHSDILIMDCPTRGIDVGVKSAVYRLMEQLADQGKSIIMVSEEMPELIGMSDRILVLKDGCVSGTFLRSQKITERELVEYIV